MAGASMKDIKLRIKSVESTKQITTRHGAGRFLQAAPCAASGSSAAAPISRCCIKTIADIAEADTELSSAYVPSARGEEVLLCASSPATAVWRAATTPTCSSWLRRDGRKRRPTACCPSARRPWSSAAPPGADGSPSAYVEPGRRCRHRRLLRHAPRLLCDGLLRRGIRRA